MAFCPECKGEMGQADTVCPHCGYDFPSRDDTTPKHSTVLAQFATACLTIVLFVAGFYVLSFTRISFGESIPALAFVLSWAVILAWAFLSYRIARGVIGWMFRPAESGAPET